MCPQNWLPSQARDRAQSDARSIRESAIPIAIHPESLCRSLRDIDPHDAARPPLPPRGAHSPPVSSLRSVHIRGSAIARQTNLDKTASEFRSRQTRTPYTPLQSSILSDECPSLQKKETTIPRSESSSPFPQG